MFFRASTRSAAQNLGLTGWVRNLPDGSVEAVFEGDSDACHKALEFVKVGPPSAHVAAVRDVWDDEEESLVEFRIV